MFRALMESNLNLQLKRSLELHKDELLKMKGIPSPISDIIDAVWLVEAYL